MKSETNYSVEIVKYFIIISVVFYGIASFMFLAITQERIYTVLLLILGSGTMAAIHVYERATIILANKDLGNLIISIGILIFIIVTLLPESVARIIVIVTGPAMAALLAALIITAQKYNRNKNKRGN